jgi:hypothetical protein
MDINSIIRLGRELEAIQEESFNLWTWMPSSYFLARYHGDYASEHMGSIDTVMKEACKVMSALGGYAPKGLDLDLDAPYDCACGETHIPVTDDHDDWYGHNEKSLRERFTTLKQRLGAL